MIPRLIHRHKSCVGITLFRSSKRTIELWYAPRGFKIEPHTHPNENISLTFLFGKALFARISNVSGLAQAFVSWPWNMFKTFKISYFHTHWFEVSSRPLVFLNHARWINGVKPTTAANDIDYK